MKEINSLSNETIIKYRKLKEKKFREIERLYIVEGLRMVNDAVNCNKNINAVFIDKTKAGKFEEIIDKVKNKSKIFLLDEKVFNSLSDTVNPQGIIAALSFDKEGLPPKFNCLILDGISDPGNLGTIIRTAAAFNYKDIYLINCADVYSPKVIRSTMSGIFYVNIYEGTYKEIIDVLKSADYKIYCADMGGQDIKDFKAGEKFALAIGSEAFGLNDEIIKKSDYKIAIPMEKDSESLNAAISAAILMFELKK